MTFDVDGAPFAWRENGSGDLVVLLHGLGGSRLSWEPQLAALGSNYRVAAWDLPGYGASTALAGATTFTALARAVTDWIDVLGAGPAHIVGISMGAMIAQYTAALHPQSVRSLTLLATSPAFGLDGTPPEQWRAARLAPLVAGQQPADFAEGVLRAIAGPAIEPDALAGQVSAMGRISGDALRASIDCVVTHDARAWLPNIAAPTLVLVGDLDRETPPTYARALAEQIPHCWLHVLPGVGHLLNAEAPGEVNKAIRRHLRHTEEQ